MMYKLLGLALLGSTALWPASAIAQNADTNASQLAWQEMNDCQRLALIAERKPDQAPMSAADASNFEGQNDLASCTQAIGGMDQAVLAEVQQEYDANFGQQPAEDLAAQQPAEGTAPATDGAEAGVTVMQAAPEVIVQQPQVTVTQPAPQIVIRQQAPTITIQQPPPEIIVRMPELDVAVDVEPPEVTVQEGQPAVQMAEQPQPQVTYEEVGEPEVVFEQADPQITFQQMETAETDTAAAAEGPAGASGEEMAAAEQPEADASAQTETAAAAEEPTEEMAAAEQPEAGATGTQPADEQVATSGAEQSGQAAGMTSEPTEVAASDIIGRSVVNDAGQAVGEVQSVIELQDGGFAAVVIADEFLGIGERQYAIPFENLALATDALVVMDLNDEALAQSPEWDQSLAARELTAEDLVQIRIWQASESEESQQ